MDDADLSLAQSNEALASSYDVVPYDPVPLEFLGVARVRAVAALFGCAETVGDVLDLGCGRGAQLELAAGETTGKLVGVDLSKSACEAARERLTPFADRADILCEDLLALTPEWLGQFDLIYCLGVISFVPPAVRSKVLQLISACLRPGGVAVLSYYTGVSPLLRASLGRILTAATPSDAAPAQRVSQGRTLLAKIKSDLEPKAAAHELQLAAVRHASDLNDVMFFHEMLNRESTALEASDLERQLSAEGVGFLGYQEPSPFMAFVTSKERAFAADVAGLAAGGYAYALFGKGDGALSGANPRTPRLIWSTALRQRAADGGGYRGPAVYEAPDAPLSVTIDFPMTQALLDAIAAAPLAWNEAHAAARQRVLVATGKAPVASETQIAAGLVRLWTLGAARATLV